MEVVRRTLLVVVEDLIFLPVSLSVVMDSFPNFFKGIGNVVIVKVIGKFILSIADVPVRAEIIAVVEYLLIPRGPILHPAALCAVDGALFARGRGGAAA